MSEPAEGVRDVDAEVDALYGVPLEEFTPARNSLAKRRAAAGDRAGAAAIKSLPKPAKPAWALNQLARSRPAEVAALLEAGARLRRAQERALEGDASELRGAASEVQRLVRGLAARSGSDHGLNPAQRDLVTSTLRAAAAGAEIGERLRAGRLEADAAPAGFGIEEAGVPVDADAVERSPQAVPAPGRHERQERAPRKDEERRRREAARADARRLENQAERAAAHAERLADAAAAIERRAAEARRHAGEALEEAAAARRAADDASRQAGM